MAAWVAGEAECLDRLVPLVMPELRRLASQGLNRERGRHTLQVTEVVHEAFVRLVETQLGGFASRGHFYALFARLVRELLVDHARARGRQKRGAGHELLPLEAGQIALDGSPDLDVVLAVDEVLHHLRSSDERQSQVIELRFFGGLTLRETAQVMDCSLATVERLWSVGRRRLARALGPVPNTSKAVAR